MAKCWLIFLALSVPYAGHTAPQVFFTVAGMAEDLPDESSQYGLSVRSHTLINDGPKGFFVDWDVPGQDVSISQLAVGYSWRFGSRIFTEIGAGGYYGTISGAGVLALAGFGVPLSAKFSFFFPIYYKTGGLGGFSYAPYIGWRF